MLEVLASLIFELNTSLWTGYHTEIRYNNFFLQNTTISRIQSYEGGVFAFSPDRISYTNTIGYVYNDIEFKATENCIHGIDTPFITDIVNYHEFTIRRYNKNK